MSPPHLDARLFLGLRTDIEGNAHFISDTEVIYPVGGVLVLHDYVAKKQKFINVHENSDIIKFITIAPNKEVIAISEKSKGKGERPKIAIYSLKTLKLVKRLTIPFEDITCTEFASMQFTCDSKYLVAICGEPDWVLYYYDWEKGTIESQTKAQNPSGHGKITQVNCNPNDPALVVLTGPGTFRLMNIQESVWRQWGWAKAENIVVTSCMWLTQDKVVIGTNNGVLMTVENGELKESWCYKGLEIVEINMKKTEDKGDAEMLQIKERFNELITRKGGEEVRCLTNFEKGFSYSCSSGLVHMFEKELKFTWFKRNIFKIMDGPFRTGVDEFTDLNIIQHISVNPSQNMLLVTTLKSQLYFVKLFEEHMKQIPEIPFKELGQKLHHSTINGLAMCSWKPLFMTSGKDDRSIRLWNYETEKMEFCKYYDDEIYSISLHPTGLFALIGFSDKLRYVVVLIDDLQQMREFLIKKCKVCRYSNNGHMFAAVSDLTIQVFSTISFQNMYILKGHCEMIRSLSWGGRDDKLFSCGADGAIYEWCMTTGNRIGEVVMKNNDFTDCSASSDGKAAYVVGVDGELKEARHNTITRNLKIIGIKLDTIVLARSDLMIFVTGGNGNVISIQCPLLDKAVFSEFHVHNRNITAIALSYDDHTLITVAEDATMCIWKLSGTEGKAIVMDKDFSYTEEILINKNNLQDKIINIEEMSKRIYEMDTEHSYQLQQVNKKHNKQISGVHVDYSSKIQELNEKIEHMEFKHSDDISLLNDSKEKIVLEYEKNMALLEVNFNAKAIVEYNKYLALEEKTIVMRKEYEERIEQLKKEKALVMEDIQDNYEYQLMEKNRIIKELEEKNQLEADQHEYIKELIEGDADREIIDIKTAYERQLKDEKDLNVRLKGEVDVFRRKMIAAQKDIENFHLQITQFKDENKQYQDFITKLEKDITGLKGEITNRDQSIQLGQNDIANLKIMIRELEKYKFVLSYKIELLEQQIVPKDNIINQLEEQIERLEQQESRLTELNQHAKHENETLKGRIVVLQKELKRQLQKYYDSKYILGCVRSEILELSYVIQHPDKLKIAVKALLKYKDMPDEELSFDKPNNLDDICKFNQQKEYLEQEIVKLKKELKKVTADSKKSVLKIMEENNILLQRINDLRTKLERTNIH